MQKYTTKALLQLEFEHSPSKCTIRNCPKCADYYAYRNELRLQGEVMNLVHLGRTLKDIATAEHVSMNQIQDIVTANTNGKTISSVQKQAYQAQVTTLVANGSSIPAIAKRMGKTVAAIRSYLISNCLDYPQAERMNLEKVEYHEGYRYFDKRGVEYEVRKCRGNQRAPK